MPRKHKEKGVVKRFLNSRIFLLVALGIAIFIAIGYARLYYEDYRVRQEIEELETELQSLQTKRFESLTLLDYVTSEDFLDRAAREEMQYKQPGEHVVVISDNTAYTQEVGDGRDERDFQTAYISNFKKWILYFTHK